MNERIKELAEQSGVIYDWDPGTDGPEVYFDRQEDFEKFAELIVRECASLNFRSTGEVTTEGEGIIGDLILGHFGVE